MSAENFNTFLETDPGSVITRTSSRVTWTDLETRQDNTHVSLDKGVGFFDESFVHTLTISLTASEKAVSQVNFWAMTNELDDFQALIDGSKDGLFVQMTHPNSPDVPVVAVKEMAGGSVTQEVPFNLTAGVVLYLTITRDETASANGDLILTIYSDAERATLLDSQTVTLTQNVDFRYVMVGQSIGAPSGGSTIKKTSGYSEDLDLVATGGSSSGGITPEVTTDGVSDVAATTLTALGTLVDLGLTAVTAHGHVWATTVDPDTGDNVVDNGAGSVGGFTSALTGLTSGQVIFIRAFATNSHGTTYGNGISMTVGAAPSVLKKADLSVVQTRLHYVGGNGQEYWLQGIVA